MLLDVQTVAEIATHNHSGSSSDSSGLNACAHPPSASLTSGGSGVSRVRADTGAVDLDHNHTITIGNNGSSHPMNNVQPTMAMNYIIFANA